jgi:vacuolar-type H+-ATPase subunit I/STV1
VQTLFRGETLRGLLLYAWGWSVVGVIAFWVGVAALLGAFAVFLALLIGFLAHRRHANSITPERITSGIADRQPVPIG